MDFLLALPFRLVFGLLQRLPLTWIVRLGRGGGTVAWWLLRRHRRVAVANLQAAFGSERSAEEIQELARENFRRLGENYACAIRTAAMSQAELAPHLEVVGAEQLPRPEGPGATLIVAAGHFGNFELYARIADRIGGWKIATTYRALRPAALNQVFRELRERSGTQYFERTSEARELREHLLKGGVALGLLSDQHGGPKGLWIPFFGRPCSTTPSPAVFALRYRTPLWTAFCFRIGPGRWRIEFGHGIATQQSDGSPRPAAEIMLEVNQAFEEAIRRDPANWFWVHRRWKPPTDRQRGGASISEPTRSPDSSTAA